MSPRARAFLQFGALLGVAGLLFLLFPAVLKFVEAAAMELRYLWWLVLLVALAAWLWWSASRKPPK